MMLLLLLTGCTTVQTDSVKVIRATVPVPKVYTRAEQKAMAAEMVKGLSPHLNQAMADYSLERDELRVIIKSTK